MFSAVGTWRLLRRTEQPDGRVFALFFAGYGAWRLLLFPLRADPGPPVLFALASSQIWSLVAIATGLALWPRRRAPRRGTSLTSSRRAA